MKRPFANPRKVCFETTRLHSAPILTEWFPATIEKLSRSWVRVS